MLFISLIVGAFKALVIGFITAIIIEIVVQTMRVDKLSEQEERDIFSFEKSGTYKADCARIERML